MHGKFFIAAAALIAAAIAPAKAADKPNIVVIMGDDVGWFNIGAYHRGMMSGKTPNLDELASAREGLMLTLGASGVVISMD